MRSLFKAVGVLVTLVVCAGCVTPPPAKDYSKFLASDPHSILLVPPVNRTAEVTAGAYFLSTVPLPLTERGYYVFPTNLVKRTLEDDGLYDADLVHTADPTRLAELFGADTILYISIERWNAQYLVINTQVAVEFDYKLVDGKTGDVLWQERRSLVYNSSQGDYSSAPSALVSIFIDVIAAAATKAAPNYMPLAREVNAVVFQYPGPGFPAGPYNSNYGTDLPSDQVNTP